MVYEVIGAISGLITEPIKGAKKEGHLLKKLSLKHILWKIK